MFMLHCTVHIVSNNDGQNSDNCDELRIGGNGKTALQEVIGPKRHSTGPLSNIKHLPLPLNETSSQNSMKLLQADHSCQITMSITDFCGTERLCYLPSDLGERKQR